MADGAHAGVFPGLGQAVVHKGLEAGRVVLHFAPQGGEFCPGGPQAKLVVQAVDVIATDFAVGVLSHPATGGDHGGLVVLFNAASIFLAHVPDLAAILAPVQPGPFEVLHVATVRAWNVVASLVALEPLGFDAAQALDLRAADIGSQRSGRKCTGAPIEHFAGVIAAREVVGEFIELVHEQLHDRCGLQPGRAARMLQIELAAHEVFEGACVGRVPAGHAAPVLVRRQR